MPSPRLANHFAGLVPEPLPDLPIESAIDLPIDFSLDATRTDADAHDDAEATQADGLEPEATWAEAWRVSRRGRDGLEVLLALPEIPRPAGPIRLTTAQRLQLVLALEERVGVPMDGPVRSDLLADDTLSARLERDALAFSLDRTDGEVLFGAPIYHAWLALEEQRGDDSPTRPGAGRGAH